MKSYPQSRKDFFREDLTDHAGTLSEDDDDELATAARWASHEADGGACA